MSGSRARASRRTGPKAVRAEVIETRACTGICNHAGLAIAKRQTHDSVIALAGAARRSGVRWSITTGEAAASNLELLAAGEMEQAPPAARPALQAELDRMRAMLRDLPDGHLVVAMADVAVPRAFAGPS